MHDISDHSEPITGLILEPFPDQPVPNEVKYFILATTPKRIYQFLGTVIKGDCPQFIELFGHYDAGKGTCDGYQYGGKGHGEPYFLPRSSIP